MTDIVGSKWRTKRMAGIRGRDNGQDTGSPSHGANAAGAAVPQSCHADGGGSGGIPLPFVVRRGCLTPLSQRNERLSVPISVEPTSRITPKSRWRLRRILHDRGEGGWSAAEGQWENDGLWGEVLTIRSNGSAEAEIANTRSRGLAMWFILLEELEQPVRDTVATPRKARRRS